MMRNSVAILIMIALSCSCDEEMITGGINGADCPSFIIVDPEFNDRLNPGSPGYFGEEYVKGIELSVVFYKGEEKVHKNITPFLYEDRMMLGYYYITLIPSGAQNTFYIRYPDGSEDKIRLQYFMYKGRITNINEMWINGELAYKAHAAKEGHYFNPKYYHRMRYADNDGKEIISYIVVLTK